MSQPSRFTAFTFICAVVASVACSVYDDSLLDGSRNEATKTLGSGASGDGGSGGGAGSSGAGSSGVPTAEGEAGAPTSFSEPPCDGLRHEDLCWYLGDQGDSCENTCVPHGGFAPAGESSVGTGAQHGSLESCASLMLAFGVVATPTEGYRDDGSGLGCHLYGGAPYWLSNPDFSPKARDIGASILCSCQR